MRPVEGIEARTNRTTSYGGRIRKAPQVFKPYNLHISEHEIPNIPVQKSGIRQPGPNKQVSEITERAHLSQESRISEPAPQHQELELPSTISRLEERAPEENQMPPASEYKNEDYKMTLYPPKKLKKDSFLDYKQDQPLKNWGRILIKVVGWLTLIYPLYLLASQTNTENNSDLVKKTSKDFKKLANFLKSTTDCMLEIGEPKNMDGLRNACSDDDINKRIKNVQNFKNEMNASNHGRKLLQALRYLGLETLKKYNQSLDDDYFILLEENGVQFAIKSDDSENCEIFVMEPGKDPTSLGIIPELPKVLNEIFGVKEMADFINYRVDMPADRIQKILDKAINDGNLSKLEYACNAIVGNPFAKVIEKIEQERQYIENFLKDAKELLTPLQEKYSKNVRHLLEKSYSILERNDDHERNAALTEAAMLERVDESYGELYPKIENLIDEALKESKPYGTLEEGIKLLINKTLSDLGAEIQDVIIDAIRQDLLENIHDIYSLRGAIKNNDKISPVIIEAKSTFNSYTDNLTEKVPVYIAHILQDYYGSVAKDVMEAMLQTLAVTLTKYTKNKQILSIDEKIELFELVKFLNSFYKVDTRIKDENPLFDEAILAKNTNHNIVDDILRSLTTNHISQLTNSTHIKPKPPAAMDGDFILLFTNLLRLNIIDANDNIDSIKTLKKFLGILNPEDASFVLASMPQSYQLLNQVLSSLYLSGV